MYVIIALIDLYTDLLQALLGFVLLNKDTDLTKQKSITNFYPTFLT